VTFCIEEAFKVFWFYVDEISYPNNMTVADVAIFSGSYLLTLVEA
jgi:hypothetical protein